MNPEKYIKFLLNQFVPSGIDESELPIWVINLKQKLMSSVLRSLKNMILRKLTQTNLLVLLPDS